MTLAVLFPGQGTQKPEMGVAWRGHAAWAVVDEIEAALDEPVGNLLLTADESTLAHTREAQLAVFLASLVAWRAFAPTLEDWPVAFAGHSLGQLTAMVASGALSVSDGAQLVAARAEATQAAADKRPGRMAALLGVGPDDAATACAAASGRCWVANDNAPNQVVISGTPEAVDAVGAAARLLGAKRTVTLNVGGAVHTPLMEGARTSFASALDATSFHAPMAPVVCNTDAAACDASSSSWNTRLADHLVSAVKWRQSMATLEEMGVTECVEVGPGRVLTGLVGRTTPDIAVRNVASPDDLGDRAAA
jgi:[acyl-carrier-protein] S-malonyltransferase